MTGSFCWARGLSWIAKGKALHLCTVQWEMGTKRLRLLPDLLLVLARKFQSATKGFEVIVVRKIGKKHHKKTSFFVYFGDAVYPAVWHSSGTSQDVFRNVRLCFPNTVLIQHLNTPD